MYFAQCTYSNTMIAVAMLIAIALSIVYALGEMYPGLAVITGLHPGVGATGCGVMIICGVVYWASALGDRRRGTFLNDGGLWTERYVPYVYVPGFALIHATLCLETYVGTSINTGATPAREAAAADSPAGRAPESFLLAMANGRAQALSATSLLTFWTFAMTVSCTRPSRMAVQTHGSAAFLITASVSLLGVSLWTLAAAGGDAPALILALLHGLTAVGYLRWIVVVIDVSGVLEYTSNRAARLMVGCRLVMGGWLSEDPLEDRWTSSALVGPARAALHGVAYA